MSEILVPDYDMSINPAWYWLYNYRTQSWDKAETGLDGSIHVYQWSREDKKWAYPRVFKNISYSFLGRGATEDDYAYWYSPGIYAVTEVGGVLYINPNEQKDRSSLGQVWKWNGSKWVCVNNKGVGMIDTSKKTYIIVHGLRNSYEESWISSMAKELSKKGQVLCIDWGDKAYHDDFFGDFNASNIDNAAARAAVMLSQVLGVYDTSYSESNILAGSSVDLKGFESNIVMVGHSFGAHLSAYFSKYLKGTLDTIYGLDSAEEQTQNNPIILGPNSASNVYFFKSSDFLGGGDTWCNPGDRLLGRYNFYVSGPLQLTAEDGLSEVSWPSIWPIDFSKMFEEFDAHGYAHSYFTRSANSNYTGMNFDPDVLKDINKYGLRWNGIINGANCQIECVTIGYELNKSDRAVALGWGYSEYSAAVDRILSEPFFTGSTSELDMPKEIYAVSYMTSLDIADLNINGSVAPDVGASGAVTEPIDVNSNSSFSVNFTVKNYADNVSFATDEVSNAQQNQHMTHEIWVSTDSVLDVTNSRTAVKLYSSLEAENSDGLSSINPMGTDTVNASVEIDDDTIDLLLAGNSELRRKYETTGKLDLFMHVRVGVNGEDSSRYISGELQTTDNIQTQAITVNKGGIDVAFVIDTTGSMGDEIASVRDAIKRKIYDLAETDDGYCEIPTMMLVTFKDNHSVQIVTNDMEEMLRAVSSLGASGGGDTPEHSNHALNTAINSVARHGKIFIATDAPSHKGPNVSAMVRKAKSKDIAVSVLVTGTLDSSGSAVIVSPDAAVAAVSDSMVCMVSSSSEEPDISTEESMDDVAGSASTIVIGETATGDVSYIGDRYDWYKVNLKAEHTYSIGLDSGEQESFLTLYASDAETELRVISSGEQFSVCPDANGTYYLRVRAYGFENTHYALDVTQIAEPSTVGSTLESFSILATETGGVYLALDRPGNSAERAKYEAAVYNLLTSMQEPAVISVGPDDAPRGATMALEVLGSNTNWRKGQTTVDFGTKSIIVNSVDVISASKLIVNVSVAADCSLESYGVTVQSGTEVAEGKGVLTVIRENSAQKILSVTLTSSVCGSDFSAIIHGNATNWNETTRLSLGPDVNITSFRVVDATTISVEGNIDKDADLGFRTVRVESEGRTLTLDKAFFVSSTAALTPEITLVSPAAITAGSESTLTITGRNVDFTNGKVTVDLGYGITVTSLEVVDALTLKVTLSAASDVSEGFRDVKVTVNDQQAILLDGLDVTIANDSIDEAIKLPFASDNRVYRLDSLGVGDSVDYFLITPEESGAYRVGIESTELVQQVVLSVGIRTDEGGYAPFRSIVVDSGSAIEEIRGLGLEAGENYYIVVQTTGLGTDDVQTPYTLSVDPCGDKVVTADNSATTANLLTWAESGEPANRGWVGYGDAVDFYSFALEDSSQVRMVLGDLTCAARVSVFKENAAGGMTQVSTNSVRTSGLDRTLSLTSGTYFVEVASYDSGAGRYNTAYSLELERECEEGETKRFAIANA